MKRSTAALLLIVVAIPFAVLGYGYWFGKTRGALYVSVEDVPDREHPRSITPVGLSFEIERGTSCNDNR
jgi:hypothetical protein